MNASAAGAADAARKVDITPGAAQRPAQANAGDVRSIVRATDYLGKTVVNARDEKLGEIVDLAVDGARGRVVYAVLAAGGFLSVGQTLYAVPLDALRLATPGDELRLDVTATELDERDAFDSDHWPAQANHALVDEAPADLPSRPRKSPPANRGDVER